MLDPDGSTDVDGGMSDVDGGTVVDGGVVTDGGMTDGGVIPTGPSTPSAPPEVVRAGTGGFLLRGVVLAPSGPISPGEVLIVGDTIQCVAADCSATAGADTVTVIQTNGVISAGLVDGHNHLPYDFLPEWAPTPAMLFNNRYEWAADSSYEAHILPYSAHRSTGTHFCPAAKWGELRALAHGTTTIQGQTFNQSCIDRLVRNADSQTGLGTDFMQTSIGSPREFTDAQAATYVANFTSGDTTRLAVHMGEGVSGDNIELEFGSFTGHDTRTNRHMGLSLLAAMDGAYSGVGLLIHSVAVTDMQLMEAQMTDSKIVWSPSSNMVLYGQTADIARILELGITVGLGPDWTLSGEDDMLGELVFAYEYGVATGIDALTPQRLIEMATRGSAVAVGLDSYLGTLEVGRRADVSVFGRMGIDPYRAVIDSRPQDVRLVFIDGQGYYGDLAMEMATSVNGSCDMLDACGAMKFVCIANTPGAASRADEHVEDIETQLVNILEGTGYPSTEQYGRGADLLPLVNCP